MGADYLGSRPLRAEMGFAMVRPGSTRPSDGMGPFFAPDDDPNAIFGRGISESNRRIDWILYCEFAVIIAAILVLIFPARGCL